MGKIKASINPFHQTDKTKNFFQNASDTLTEVFGLFIAAVLVAGIAYAVFEGKDLGTGLWWAIVTGFTVGYGDLVPHTVGGQVTGALLMTFTVFIMIPLITALFAKRLIVNDDAWTDVEQKELMNYVKRANNRFDIEDAQERAKADAQREKQLAKVAKSVKTTKKGKK